MPTPVRCELRSLRHSRIVYVVFQEDAKNYRLFIQKVLFERKGMNKFSFTQEKRQKNKRTVLSQSVCPLICCCQNSTTRVILFNLYLSAFLTCWAKAVMPSDLQSGSGYSVIAPCYSPLTIMFITSCMSVPFTTLSPLTSAFASYLPSTMVLIMA